MNSADLVRLKPVLLTDWEDDRLSNFTNNLFEKYSGYTKEVEEVSDNPKKYYAVQQRDDSSIIHMLFKDSLKQELAAICIDCLPYKNHVGNRKYYGQSNFNSEKWAQSINLRDGKRQIFVYDNRHSVYHGIITEYRGELALALNNKRGYEKGENNRVIEFFNLRVFDEDMMKQAPDLYNVIRTKRNNDMVILSRGLSKLASKDKTGLSDCGTVFANESSEAKDLVERLIFTEDFYLAEANIKMLARLYNFGIKGDKLVQLYRLCENNTNFLRTVSINIEHEIINPKTVLEKINDGTSFNTKEIIPEYFIIRHPIANSSLWQSPIPAQLREDVLREGLYKQRSIEQSQNGLSMGSQVLKAIENNYLKIDIYLAKQILNKLKNFEERAYKEGYPYTDSWLYGEGLVAKFKKELVMGIEASTYEVGSAKAALKTGQKLEDCSDTILISRVLAVELMQDMRHIIYIGSVLREKLEKELMKGTKKEKKNIKKKDEGRPLN